MVHQGEPVIARTRRSTVSMRCWIRTGATSGSPAGGESARLMRFPLPALPAARLRFHRPYSSRPTWRTNRITRRR